MKCPHCHSDQVPAGARFCPQCGEAVAAPLPDELSEYILDFSRLLAFEQPGFVGRQWLETMLDDALEGHERVFIISGELGVGKTAFLAHLAETRKYVHHFVSSTDLDWLSPVAFAQSIGAQLARQFGLWVLSERELSPSVTADVDVGVVESGGSVIAVLIGQYVGLPVEEIARKRVLKPLRRLADKMETPIVLLVDAVDEAVNYSQQPTIADLLAGLGDIPGLFLILSVHPGRAQERLLNDLGRSGMRHVVLDTASQENLQDIREYVRHAVQETAVRQALETSALTPEEFVAQVEERSEGNFLYVTSLLDAIRTGGGGLELEALPLGLKGLYRDLLQAVRQAAGDEWDSVYRPVLGILMVAREALAIGDLARFAGVEPRAASAVVERAQHMLEFSQDEQGRPTCRLYHHALVGFLSSERDLPYEWFDPVGYHGRFADRLLPADGEPPTPETLATQLSPYAMRHLARHLRAAGPQYHEILFHGLISPVVREARWEQTGSDHQFSLDVDEALAAAQGRGLDPGLPVLARCGLIGSTLSAIVMTVEEDVLRDLAWHGQWDRALTLAQLDDLRAGPALRAVCDGLLRSDRPDRAELALTIAQQIPEEARNVTDKCLALARAAAELAAAGSPERAGLVFSEAVQLTERISEPDERGRALSKIGLWRTPSEPERAREHFTAALEIIRSMRQELGQRLSDHIGAETMMAQTTLESRWIMRRTLFDTVGSKARAMADVAAALARAGDPRAEAAFAEAESLADALGRAEDEAPDLGAEMESARGAGFSPRAPRDPASALETLFARHAREYIKAQRALPSTPEPTRQSLSAIEKKILEGTHLPADRRGFEAAAHLAIATALAGDEAWLEQARAALETALELAKRASGGYQAKLLADSAALLDKLGYAERATETASEAAALAADEVDLLAGYQRLLLEKGYEWSAELYEVAYSRALIQKQRYYADKALVAVIEAVAAQDPEQLLDADSGSTRPHFSVLIDEIRDPSQRARALAMFAGSAAVDDPNLAQSFREAILAVVDEVAADEQPYVLAGAVETLAERDPGGALELCSKLPAGVEKVRALVAVAEATSGTEAVSIWSDAWTLAQSLDESSTTLGLALGRLAVNGLSDGEERKAALLRAREVVEGVDSLPERAEALVGLALLLSDTDPEQARSCLDAAEDTAGKLARGRARGQALSKIAGVTLDLDPAAVLPLLVELRHQGRDSFLDGIGRLAPALARRGQRDLLWQVHLALKDGHRFFSPDFMT